MRWAGLGKLRVETIISDSRMRNGVIPVVKIIGGGATRTA